jgi:hypothetical protein
MGNNFRWKITSRNGTANTDRRTLAYNILQNNVKKENKLLR